MDAKWATKEIKIRYGKIIFPKCTARSNASLFSEKPGAKIWIIYGIPKKKIIVKPTVTKSSNDMVFSTKSAASWSSFESITIPEKTGIKAALYAPSAKTRRKKLGILKAKKKASYVTVDPR